MSCITYNGRFTKSRTHGNNPKVIIHDITGTYFHLASVLKYSKMTVRKWRDLNAGLLTGVNPTNGVIPIFIITRGVPVEYRGVYLHRSLFNEAVSHCTDAVAKQLTILYSTITANCKCPM